MRTVMNGNKWSGACVNGSIVSGLVKNGIVFYRKSTSLNKRRIMVGDDLRNKMITNTPHTSNVYQFLKNYIDTNSNWHSSFISTEDEQLDPNYEKSGYMAIQQYESTGIYVLYEFYSGRYKEFLNGEDEESMITYNNVEIPFADDDLSVVTEIVDTNPVYRWLYIEDPNIRPLQVGDKIVSGTKIYFNFPDNLSADLNNDRQIIRISTDNSIETGIVAYFGGGDIEIIVGSITYSSTGASTINIYSDIYTYTSPSEQFHKNISFGLAGDLLFLKGQSAGTVTEIDQNNNIYNYILVDETTLGT